MCRVFQDNEVVCVPHNIHNLITLCDRLFVYVRS